MCPGPHGRRAQRSAQVHVRTAASSLLHVARERRRLETMNAMKTLPIVLGLVLLASPVLASRHPTSCNKIRAAVDAGKTQQQVAKDMKTSMDHVKHCTAQSGGDAAK
jgi:hypothetical protein